MSGCEGGEVNVWNVDSGGQILRFTHAHNKHEITAMALDSSGRRLITGSRAGDIKVTGFSESRGLSRLHPTGLVSVISINLECLLACAALSPDRPW